MKSLIESLLDDGDIQADKLIGLVENIGFDDVTNIRKGEDWDDFLNNMREYLKMFSRKPKFNGIELGDKRGTYYICFRKGGVKRDSLAIGSRSNYYITMYFHESFKEVIAYEADNTMNDIAMPYDEIYIMDSRLMKSWRKNKSKFNG